MFKCVKCGLPATYIVDGNSVCDAHFKTHIENDNLAENKYYSLLNNFKGKVSTLDYFWLSMTRTGVNLTFNDKARFLEQINKVVDTNNIIGTVINDALGIAARKNNFKLPFIITVMKNCNKRLLDKVAQESSNDDIFAKIAKNS
ncbi:MAG: hypothetical protein PHN69_04985 [Candidatus Pacebacteria bacterium]|nr:hypothetical protein [Candidatus Paceibacterota bacterium]